MEGQKSYREEATSIEEYQVQEVANWKRAY